MRKLTQEQFEEMVIKKLKFHIMFGMLNMLEIDQYLDEECN